MRESSLSKWAFKKKITAAVYNSTRGNVSRPVFKSSTSAEETLLVQLTPV